jgi:diguanylate cyclase (GGDEF)-like protein
VANDDVTGFVMVSRRGVKTHELVIEELANMLEAGSAKILEESDIPLTDRASHRMLQNMHNQLTHQATHDELTGLVNRKEFERQLSRALSIAKQDKVTHMIAYIDLDQFKVINNTCGHEGGDKLLTELANLLQDELDPDRLVLSRLGGDEYGILVERCDREDGLAILKTQCDAIKAYRFDWENQQFSLTPSCGVVSIDHQMESVSAILSAADSACYAAKDAGRDRTHIYEIDDMEMERRRDVMEFVSQIDKALKDDRFVLNCQRIEPIDNEGIGRPQYEILLTVLDDSGKPLPPADFIIAVETYYRMGLIDRWVIKNSFRWIAKNILQLEDLGPFSINISGNSLTESDFMEFVLTQFDETQLPTSKICFEITETSAIGSLDDEIEFIERLKVIGVKFSLDDFGTGLSSYSHLRSLPVDFLKIDGIFVKDIKTNPNDHAVVKSINEIGHFMGRKRLPNSLRMMKFCATWVSTTRRAMGLSTSDRWSNSSPEGRASCAVCGPRRSVRLALTCKEAQAKGGRGSLMSGQISSTRVDTMSQIWSASSSDMINGGTSRITLSAATLMSRRRSRAFCTRSVHGSSNSTAIISPRPRMSFTLFSLPRRARKLFNIRSPTC